MGDDQGNVVRDGGAIDSSEKVDDETDSTLMLALKHGIMTQETWDTKRIGIDDNLSIPISFALTQTLLLFCLG